MNLCVECSVNPVWTPGGECAGCRGVDASAGRAAAVQIVRQVLSEDAPPVDSVSVKVVAALDKAGWLHPPARVAALEAENAQLREKWERALQEGDAQAYRILELRAALDGTAKPETIADIARRTFPFAPTEPDPAAHAWWGDEG